MSAELHFPSDDYALVRINHISLVVAQGRDAKFSLAETLWCSDSDEAAVTSFITEMRRLFHPDPAHVIDTTADSVLSWRIVDFDRHPFVLDGEDACNLSLGAIRQAPARIAAEQTYAVVVAERLPACFLVAMTNYAYQRAMFPFFSRDGRVTRVATLIRPLSPTTPPQRPLRPQF
ncbi:MAG: hypothetical protein VW600_04810 [Ferrovibrio sp.]